VDRHAAGPVLYLAVVLGLAKLARAAELALRHGNLRAFWLLPVSLGEDLVLLAALGLLLLSLRHLRRPRLELALTLLVLVPIAVLLPADVLSHMLTGRPLTAQRLAGAEGATLADTNLLDPADLLGGCAGIALGLIALWPALRFGPRWRALRRASRPKPLLLLLVLGFALSMLQTAIVPRTQGLSDQPVFVLVASIFESSEVKPLAVDQPAWRELHTPGIALPPPPAAPRRTGSVPKNVVIFLGEGIPFKATGFDRRFAKTSNPTPNLLRRFGEHGLLFDQYRANWHASIQAIFSIVCSAFPPLSGDIVRIKPRIDCGEFSEVMRARDVAPGLFHSGQFSFYNKLALLGRRAYETEQDAQEMAKTSHRATHQWGIDDRAMVDSTLAWVDSLPKQRRFAALMIAVSPHYPYWLPPDFQPPFPSATREQQFHNGVAFLDTAFEQLLRGFEQRGLYDDTLFVWLGDHGHYVGEPERETPGLRQFYEPNLHTPLVLINSRMFPSSLARAQRVNSRLGSHPDLLPTVLDALGLSSERRHQGQSLLHDAFEPRRVFFGATDGRYVGFIEGPYKFVHRTQRRGHEYYDLDHDPEELHDLSQRFPERMKLYGKQAMRFAGGVEAAIAAAPVLRESVSVDRIYDLFFQHVAVQLSAAGHVTQCSGGEAASCPELGPVLRMTTAVMQGDKRRCVLVKVPPSSTIELSVADPDTLDLMTGTIVAIPPRKGSQPRFEISVTADGKKLPPSTLTAREVVRPGYPRVKRSLRFGFRQLDRSADAAELCLQLTALFSR
jgi:hypothetical protein